jgi:hypothetical protein
MTYNKFQQNLKQGQKYELESLKYFEYDTFKVMEDILKIMILNLSKMIKKQLLK